MSQVWQIVTLKTITNFAKVGHSVLVGHNVTKNFVKVGHSVSVLMVYHKSLIMFKFVIDLKNQGNFPPVRTKKNYFYLSY